MKEFQLKYGCNPNQKPSRIYMADGSDLPIEILNGRPGYINFLDAFNSWQLVKELKESTGMPCATSFKHVSPTSAAVGKKLSDRLKKACFVDDIEGLDDSPLACAYARARGTDRMSSFGDWIAPLRRVRRSHGEHHQARGLRRHHRARLYAEGARDPQRQKEGRLQRRQDRCGLPSGPDRAQAGVRHHVRAGPQRVQDRRSAPAKHCHPQQGASRRCQDRSDHLPHHAQIHPVQLRLFCGGRAGDRRRGRAAVAHPLHAARRQQGGSVAPAPERQSARPAVCRKRQPSR